MNLSDLNEHEISTLKKFRALDSTMWETSCWIEIFQPSAEFRQAIDILVLSGLAERREDPRNDPAPFGDTRGWLDQWRLTPAGVEAADYQPQISFLAS
jgi:hypothetical protein